MTRATPGDRDRTDTFVAELTLAAYRVARQAGTRGGTWVDLQLGLWRALADEVKVWEQEGRSGRRYLHETA